MDNFKTKLKTHKRLFIGIKVLPTENFLKVFSTIKSRFNSSDIRWAKPTNFHITLRFLGNIPISDIHTLNKAIAESAINHSCFSTKLKSIGTFGKTTPKILWIGVEENPELMDIYQSINKNLLSLGYNFKDISYHPHLTIGRIKQINSDIILSEIESELNEKLIQEIQVSEIDLFESTQSNEGPVYTILSSHKLTETTYPFA